MEIFVSYSHRDHQAVETLVRLLEDEGFDVWSDRHLGGGDIWSEELAAACRRCDVMLVVCSRAALGSTHVAREVDLAGSRDGAEPVFLPVVVERVRWEGPLAYWLSGAQRLDLVGVPEHAWGRRLADAMSRHGEPDHSTTRRASTMVARHRCRASASIRWMDATADTSLVVVGGDTDGVEIAEVDQGDARSVSTDRTGPSGSGALSADGTKVLVGHDDGVLRLYDVRSGVCLEVFRGHRGPVLAVWIASGGRLAVSAGTDGTLRTWSRGATAGRAVLVDVGAELHEAAIASDGGSIVAGELDGTLHWATTDGSRSDRRPRGWPVGEAGAIDVAGRAFAVTAGGRILVHEPGADDPAADVADLVPAATGRHLALAGPWLVCADDDGGVRRYDTTGDTDVVIGGSVRNGSAAGCAVTSDGAHLVTANSSGAISWWSVD